MIECSHLSRHSDTCYCDLMLFNCCTMFIVNAVSVADMFTLSSVGTSEQQHHSGLGYRVWYTAIHFNKFTKIKNIKIKLCLCLV
jgi:hypothetical protein